MKSSLHRIEIISLDLTPVELANCCRNLPGFIFFDSALAESEEERISILAANPSETLSGRTETDWAVLRAKLRTCSDAFEANLSTLEGDPRLKALAGKAPLGMAAGYVEYEGEFLFGFYHGMLVYEHSTGIWLQIGQVDWANLPEEPPQECSEQSNASSGSKPDFSPTLSRKDFCGMVARAKDYIAAGDIYQVNLSQKFTAKWECDAWRFYQSLRHYSAAPHATYLHLGQKTILSSSPELFLQISGSRIKTKPIKGTRPRYADPVADEQSALELTTSQKEIAELVMITDLERNDLGKSCLFGSVSVTELLKLERYAQVFHLISTIEGQLRPGIDHPSALLGCFPGGSITGAPKKRAMEIIAELEPVERGVYTGAIGYFGFNGESQFNIAIRTVVIEEGTAHFHVGAGIVADSSPEFEYEETLHKAAGILISAKQMVGFC